MSYAETAALALAAGLGATFGPLGVGLCIGVAALPIMSRLISRLGPAMIATRHRFGLGMPPGKTQA